MAYTLVTTGELTPIGIVQRGRDPTRDDCCYTSSNCHSDKSIAA
jgi:hypothetical protein